MLAMMEVEEALGNPVIDGLMARNMAVRGLCVFFTPGLCWRMRGGMNEWKAME